MSATILGPRLNLLTETEDDSYFSSKPSYYKRGNLLATSSFRQKYKNGFQRSRLSSYTSLEEENRGLLEQKPAVATPPTTSSFFSRRKKLTYRSNTAPTATIAANFDAQDDGYFNQEETDIDDSFDDIYNNEDSDESAFFAKQNYYSRQNLLKPTTSWKLSVLKAVGVKSK
ncbi:hypothetical protein [Parasitella parasitica]|uniref:Uncharacterized protein n=1 Tax=Parasitella parasitica TaxID=35722 RepID=A0A0B7NSD8_9FUNG|nr:hypothetical protein [Parasitella parasitica]